MSFANPFRDRDFFRKVKLGGRTIKAKLVAVNGCKIEDEWSEQRPTGNSGATNIFKGTKPAGPVKLTLAAWDEESFDDLREIWEQLAPKAGAGGNGSGATVGSPGSAAKKYVQVPAPTGTATTPTAEDLLRQATQTLATLNAGTAASAAAATPTGTSSSASTTAAQPNPGPKPPTLSIVNGFVNYIGITAVSRKSWEGPKWTGKGGYEVEIELVSQKEPTPAAVGKSAPKSPDNPGQKSIAFGEISSAAKDAKDANAAIAAAGA